MGFVSGDPDEDNFRAPRSLFWIALIVRLAYLTLARSYRMSPSNHHFEFGWEIGRVAASVAAGQGYSSPFGGQSGPTAWMVPGFTLLLAAVFKVFGIYTTLSAWTILALNSLFQAITAPLVYEMGARIAGRRNALWSGWLWALFPGIMQYGVKWIWEMSMATMFFAAVLVLGMRMRGTGSAPPARQRVSQWIWFGLLWGAIAMTNPTLLLLAPVQGLWILMTLPRGKEWFRGAALALLSAVFCCAVATPWVVRNWMVFHAFIPIRNNLGAELAMAWAPTSNGFPWGATVPPLVQAKEYQRYATMGEPAYVKMRGQLAKAWAREYPGHFWRLAVLRFYMFWCNVPHSTDGRIRGELVEFTRCFTYCFGSITGLLGLWLALRRKLPASGLFAWAVVLLPTIYYFVTAGARFRNPLEPILLVLTVYLFQQAEPRWGFSFLKRKTADQKA
jgi:4-amino-4-deoxy-L-arabinose transferase-like glycosyltransferase